MARGKHEAAKKSEKTKPEKKPKRSGGAKKAVLIIAVVCVFLAAAALGGGYLAGHSDKIHPGMTLGGVSIGDMTVSDAAAALEKAGCDFAGGSVEVTLPGDFEFAVSAEQAGMAMSCAQAAQAAFDYGHSGNVFSDLVSYLKSITGGVTETSFNPTAKFEEAFVERREMQYLYNEGDLYYFMDNETYEQIPISKDTLGDDFRFVKENENVKVLSYKGSVFAVEPPLFVELEITETEPGVKGNTATNVLKPATVETGAVVKVPIFIEQGERIQIDTRTGEYLGRSKTK